MSEDMNRLLLATSRIVREAGVRASQIPVSSRKPLKEKAYGDFVTAGDLAVQDHVIAALRRLRSDCGFDSEEMDKENTQREYVWVLDPIDGTKHYARDIPLYSVSLALKRRDEPILGVVHCPELNRLYSACLDAEATLNGVAINCSTVECLEQASICLEIPSSYSSRDEQRWAIEKMSVLIERSYRVRIIGVGSLGLCFCAEGGFDAYVNLTSTTKPHDTAAGEIIMRRAGGEFLRVGRQHKQIVAGPQTLCARIRELLRLSRLRFLFLQALSAR